MLLATSSALAPGKAGILIQAEKRLTAISANDTEAFQGNVKVLTRDFKISCDQLEIVHQLRKENEPPLDGIEKLNGKGYVVYETTLKDGKPLIGKARVITYDRQSGEFALSDYPTLKLPNNGLVRGRENDKIYIKPDGTYRTEFQIAPISFPLSN